MKMLHKMNLTYLMSKRQRPKLNISSNEEQIEIETFIHV